MLGNSTYRLFIFILALILAASLIFYGRRQMRNPPEFKIPDNKTESSFTDPDLEYDVDVQAPTTSEVNIERNIKYGPSDKQAVDICAPKGQTGSLPLVLLIHGGGGDKSQYASTCRRLAASGYLAAAINYREEPAPAYPKALDDTEKALAFLRNNRNVNPARTASMGGSAGGFLSSLLGTKETDQKVMCVVNQFGPTDLTDPAILSLPIWKTRLFPKMFGNVSYEEDPQLYKNASPITYVSGDDADFFFTRSTNDPLIPKSQPIRMIEALRKVGKIVPDLYEFDGNGGGHATRLPSQAAEKLWNAQKNFLDNCLRVK